MRLGDFLVEDVKRGSIRAVDDRDRAKEGGQSSIRKSENYPQAQPRQAGMPAVISTNCTVAISKVRCRCGCRGGCHKGRWMWAAK